MAAPQVIPSQTLCVNLASSRPFNGVMIVSCSIRSAGVLSYSPSDRKSKLSSLLISIREQVDPSRTYIFWLRLQLSHVQCSIYFPLPQYPGTIPLLSSHILSVPSSSSPPSASWKMAYSPNEVVKLTLRIKCSRTFQVCDCGCVLPLAGWRERFR